MIKRLDGGSLLIASCRLPVSCCLFLLLGCQRGAAGPADSAPIETVSAEAHLARSVELGVKADGLLQSGGDPRTPSELGIAAAREAIRIDPRSPRGYQAVGSHHQRLVRRQLMLGDDPRAAVEVGADHYRKALARQPDTGCHQGLGALQLYRARWELDHGLEPTASLAAAEASLRSALSVDPRNGDAWTWLAAVATTRARGELRRGKDPARFLEEALRDGEQALQLSPRQAQPLIELARAHRIRAQHALLAGRDPAPSLAQVRELATRAIEAASRHRSDKSPENANSDSQASRIDSGDASWELALAARLEASHRLAGGLDPSASLQAARQALTRSTTKRADPEDGDLAAVGVETELLATRWALRRRQSPLPSLTAASELASGLLARRGRSLPGLTAALEVQRRRAEWELAAGHEATAREVVDGGLTLAARLLAEYPRHAEGFAQRGALELLDARLLGDAERREQARRSIATALAENPLLAREWADVQ